MNVNDKEITLSENDIKDLTYHMLFDPTDEDQNNPNFLVIESEVLSHNEELLQDRVYVYIKRMSDGKIYNGELIVSSVDKKVIEFNPLITEL